MSTDFLFHALFKGTLTIKGKEELYRRVCIAWERLGYDIEMDSIEFEEVSGR